MKYLLFAISLLFFNSAWAQKTIKVTKELGIKRYEYKALKEDESVKHGDYEEYKNDELIIEGQYDMGQRTGNWNFYEGKKNLVKTIAYDGENGIATEYKGEYRKEYLLSATDEKKIGYCKEFIEDELVAEGQYAQDEKSGTWSFYYNGDVYLKQKFENGALSEDVIYRNNKIYSIQPYKNGIKNGWYLKFYEDGDTSQKKFYSKGKLEKKSTSFYENGNISFVEEYQEGLAHGMRKQYYEDGQLRYDLNYKNGDLQGEAKYYYDNGNLMAHFKAKDGMPTDILKLQTYNGDSVNRDDLLQSGTGTMLFYHDHGPLRKELKLKNGDFHGEQKGYFSNGDLHFLETYVSGEVNGPCESYYSDGVLDGKGEVENGYTVGKWKWTNSYDEDHEIKARNYELSDKREYKPETKIHNARVYDKDLVFTVVEDMPEYPGGIQGMQKYIVKNVSYPTLEMQSNIEGVSIVQFVVDIDGSVEDVEIFDGTENKGTSNMHRESKRIVNQMPRWQPGFQRGVPVRVKYTLPIRYRLK